MQITFYIIVGIILIGLIFFPKQMLKGFRQGVKKAKKDATDDFDWLKKL